MQNWPELSKPPVQEAILDFRFRLPSNIKDENLESFCNAISAEFPHKNSRFTINLTGQIAPPASKDAPQPDLKTTRFQDGFMLSSADKKTVLQFASSFFSFHIIEPYRNWPTLINEGKRLWEIFTKHIPDITVVNISLRYLNRIELQEEQLAEGFNKYFNLMPIIPVGLPTILNNFFMQLSIPDESNELVSIINFTYEPPNNNINKFMLDISVMLSNAANINCLDTQIWEKVSKLRDFKNQIFFSSITDTTKNIYV